jgi:hypothetical protein
MSPNEERWWGLKFLPVALFSSARDTGGCRRSKNAVRALLPFHSYRVASSVRTRRGKNYTLLARNRTHVVPQPAAPRPGQRMQNRLCASPANRIDCDRLGRFRRPARAFRKRKWKIRYINRERIYPAVLTFLSFGRTHDCCARKVKTRLSRDDFVNTNDAY